MSCFKGEKICIKLPVTLSSALAPYRTQYIPSASKGMIKRNAYQPTRCVVVLESFMVVEIFLRSVPAALLLVSKMAFNALPLPTL